MKYKFILLLSFMLLILNPSSDAFWSEENDEKTAERLMLEMSDKERLSQLLLLSYPSSAPDSEILKMISVNNIGGVKLYGRNVSSLSSMMQNISMMQKLALKTRHSIPLIIATDQEGGWVRHIKGETSITPGNLAIGASAMPYDAFKTGYFIGTELKTLGINMNFAPTVDIYTNHEAHVIGPRAFSADPVQTALLSLAFYKGQEKAGVISTAKHFPGHGAADTDSHGAMPVIKGNLETIMNRELVPYRMLIKENIPAIMSGHVNYPEIINDGLPASLSPYFQTQLLKNKLGFKGLAVTDDLYMSGAWQKGFDAKKIAEYAVRAGNDLIILPSAADVYNFIFDHLFAVYKKDAAFRELVNSAAKKVIMTKLNYLKKQGQEALFPEKTALNQLPSPEASDFFLQQAIRSVTEIKKGTLPLTDKNKKILVAGQFPAFIQEGKKYFPEADTLLFGYSPFYTASPEVKNRLRAVMNNYDHIIFCLANPNSSSVLEVLKNSTAVITVFSVLSPVYLKDHGWIDSAFAVYGTGQESFFAGFSYLSGRIKAEGKLPLNIFENDKIFFGEPGTKFQPQN
jgi:beta-N-acetylhexosaminidase